MDRNVEDSLHWKKDLDKRMNFISKHVKDMKCVCFQAHKVSELLSTLFRMQSVFLIRH